ncbi:hypothetical protein Pcinc_018906 [Petrolisthes cinctipes]|uniref:Uncharacterized protein n=1 Tax=Petrolisthes cinctipes TaxID=88211 RepID=A0AAE1FLL4_PETCI|nr:hypothetical protein Pcinc_018906 [Petrolisthes cinctipes]
MLNLVCIPLTTLNHNMDSAPSHPIQTPSMSIPNHLRTPSLPPSLFLASQAGNQPPVIPQHVGYEPFASSSHNSPKLLKEVLLWPQVKKAITGRHLGDHNCTLGRG